MEVLSKFKKIFEINDQYLIINGGICAGKFYAACQKVIAICKGSQNITAVIVIESRYDAKPILNVIGDIKCEYNKANRTICFGNGSLIYIISRNETHKIIKFDYAIIKGADYGSSDVFDFMAKRRSKQIILTCNPPQDKIIDGKIIKHWINVLKEREDCYLLNVRHAGNPYI